MKYFKLFVAFTITVCIMLLVDLVVNFIFQAQTDWGVLGKEFWIIATTIGRFGVGWFFGIKVFREICKQLEE